MFSKSSLRISAAQPHSEISEVDRTFFLTLDISFSPYNIPTELGFYYETECEDTFSFNRFQVASEYFHYYHCQQALKPGQRVFVRYINICPLITELNNSEIQQLQNNLIREFHLICQHNRLGLVDVFLICSRIPNVYYIFMEKPDETLEEYLMRHNASLQNYSRSSKSFQECLIPMHDAKFISKSIASTMLELNKFGIFLERLHANSIFVFRKSIITLNNSDKHIKRCNNMQIVIKLASLPYIEVTGDRDQYQKQLEDYLRAREMYSLFELVIQIAECTKFPTIRDRAKFMNLCSYLITSDFVDCVQNPSDLQLNNVKSNNSLNSLEQVQNIWPAGKESSKKQSNQTEKPITLPENNLETFVEALWD